jgi:hypothetical protein
MRKRFLNARSSATRELSTSFSGKLKLIHYLSAQTTMRLERGDRGRQEDVR